MNDIQMIPLSKLRLSATNVRKNDTERLIDEFADNIADRGILQNLIVIPAKKGLFDVIVGGRRLRGMNKLKDRGTINGTYPVPCQVLLSATAAEQAEISLTENVIRENMTATDEIRAYKYFINEGSDLDAIAKRFGRTRRAIEGRLRLADLADPIFNALDMQEITIEVAKAYASSPNHERQMMVWEQVANSWQASNADAIRRMITNSSINSTSPIARLVTEADYLAAGGRIERDLYTTEDTANWIDPEIAQKLAAERVEAFAAETAATSGYAWVRPLLETRVTHTATEGLHSFHVADAPLTEEEQVKADELLEKISQLEAESESIDADDAEAHQAFEARWNETTEAYDQVTSKPGEIPEEMKPHVGCFVVLGNDGTLHVDTTLYSDKAVQARKSQRSQTTGTNGEADQGDTAPKPLSEKLVGELGIQRRDVLAVNLASSPAVALDYLIFVMADKGSTYGSQAHGTALRAPAPANYLQNYPESPAYTMMSDLHEGLDKSWTEHDATVDRFNALCALDDDAKASWLAFCVARTLEPSIGASRRSGQYGPVPLALHDRLAEIIEIDVTTQWRPTSVNYFDRVSKAQILAHITEVGGPTMAASFLGSKKGDLSASCEKIFAGQTIVDPETKVAALAWVPEHMRFNPSLAPETDADPDDDAEDRVGNASDPTAADEDELAPQTEIEGELESAAQA